MKVYNLRHSFGSTLASKGVDIRTIEALIATQAPDHDRTEYVAYSPLFPLGSRRGR